MSGPFHGSRITTRRVAGSLLAMTVAAGMAYAAPPDADATPRAEAVPAPGGGHHLSPRLTALAAAEAGAGARPAAVPEGQVTAPQSGPGSVLRTPDGARVVVDLRLASGARSLRQAVKDAGATILNADDHGRVAVSVLPADLTTVGDVPGVEYVSEELTPQVNAVCDSTISEGDSILHASQLRASGVDGTGVKVGVISDSYAKATAPATTAAQDIASDNLPGTANTCGHTSPSTVTDKPTAGTDEGRAMMQIVHDLAPGAPLDFATAFVSEPSFAANITALADQGAKVIVDDVSYFDEPMYQDGIVEQAVTGVRARGVDYFSSSGNNRYVKNGHEIGSYEAVGGYRNTTCPAIVTGHADCHNFGTAGSPDSTFSFTFNSNANLSVVLDWAEPWNGGVNTDLDIYLVDETLGTAPVTALTPNAGAGSQHAFEFLGAVLSGSSAHTFGLVIARKSGAPPAATPRFKMVFAENGANPFATVEHETPVAGTGDVMGPTAYGHNGGADTMSVGAASVVTAPTSLESYSSYGPVTTLFGPVNGVTPAAPLASPTVVAKPDLVASDCNINTFFGGGNRFCGTSSAAPHAAAVAALLRQKYPSATVAAINSAMVSTATPIAGVPPSFQGGGLVNALAANGPLVPPPPSPDTTLVKTPKRTVKTTKRKVKVSFSFTSTIAGSTFTCSIDGKAFTPCSSGVTYKLKAGKHTFAVRATAAGVTDATPATYSFKIKKKKKHHR